MCGCLSCGSHWGPGLQPRHVSWLGIELATLWFTGWHSVHWATPARASFTNVDADWLCGPCSFGLSFIHHNYFSFSCVVSYVSGRVFSLPHPPHRWQCVDRLKSGVEPRRLSKGNWWRRINVLWERGFQTSWKSGDFYFQGIFFKRFYLFIFRERGREREREVEKYQCVVATCTPPAWDLAWNPGVCPDWELNQWPFGSQAGTQSTGPHQPWIFSSFWTWDSLFLFVLSATVYVATSVTHTQETWGFFCWWNCYKEPPYFETSGK